MAILGIENSISVKMNAFSQHYLAQFNIHPSPHIFNNRGIPAFDDGDGTRYFCCEVPITKKGELIEVGKTYKTDDFDRLKVIQMELNTTRYLEHTWDIVGVDEETGEEEDWYGLSISENNSRFIN